ncbi:SCO1860 family LAETG-anchored protein [Streptomyces sp. NPDC014894]|uniref:SCO1860 family LAETG-anchored protein n=1 Tax=unclassified Streptomyces TaxID=2593676 RepID=UPI0036FF62A9
MNSNTFRMPAHRCAAVTAAVALLASPVALAGPAQATGGGADGKAGAVVLRAGLDVSLLNKTVRVPLTASLNAVKAPATAERTTLSARVDGVDGGRPFTMLRADVAAARATADEKRAEGHANLVRARVHLPGLPLLSLVEVEKVTSKAVCETGRRPVAASNVLGAVKVLGKRVTLSAAGRTQVTVPGVGEVTLDLSRTHTTSRTAAATALELKVALNPLNLNVAEVDGTVTLVEATCESPRAVAPRTTQKPAEEKPAEQPSPSAPGLAAQSGGEPTENLAETGGSSATGYLAVGAAVLLGLGGGAMALARVRARARSRG